MFSIHKIKHKAIPNSGCLAAIGEQSGDVTFRLLQQLTDWLTKLQHSKVSKNAKPSSKVSAEEV